MEHVFVKTMYDYSDEFTTPGFAVIPKDKYQKFVEDIKSAETIDFEVYFGSNESILFECESDVFADVEERDITQEEIATLQKLFNRESYKEFFDFGLCTMLDVMENFYNTQN